MCTHTQAVTVAMARRTWLATTSWLFRVYRPTSSTRSDANGSGFAVSLAQSRRWSGRKLEGRKDSVC
ncbi:unnamed protein product [Protopolystoma xenopodis]|uniref:Uncharacterized protein n=1 Tax=Protopolystoma xenopodis TaxID=117903 RepID=A0A448X866_9PLAT|nr:unnamed protein product [Protopolystoma xenopodis]